jgi:hypothetical protein
MVVLEVMVVGPRCLWVLVPIFLPYTCIKMQCKKYFCDTMKYKKMNDGIFKFLCLHGKYFFTSFYAP